MNRYDNRMWSGKRLLSLAEVADLLAVSVATVRRLIGSEQLRVVRVGGQLRVDVNDLHAFLDARSAPARTREQERHVTPRRRRHARMPADSPALHVRDRMSR